MGIAVVLEGVSEPASDTGAGEAQSFSSISFRLRFRTILLDTVAACSLPIASAFVVVLACLEV